jgi:hypothetical protein
MIDWLSGMGGKGKPPNCMGGTSISGPFSLASRLWNRRKARRSLASQRFREYPIPTVALRCQHATRERSVLATTSVLSPAPPSQGCQISGTTAGLGRTISVRRIRSSSPKAPRDPEPADEGRRMRGQLIVPLIEA